MSTILIVDDSASIRHTVIIALKKLGHTIEEASDGTVGVEKARVRQGAIDLFIVDLNMPEMDGLTMIRHIRRMPEYDGVPILFLTTESDDAIKMEAKEAGATGWLTKPFNADQLVRVVNRVLAR